MRTIHDGEDDSRDDKRTRREVQKLGLAVGLAAVAGCTPKEASAPDVHCGPPPGGDPDYVIVGSGAGGGPVAANLARAGYRVVLLEAGGDPRSWTREVPALHAAAAEDPEMRWDFFVRTYGDDAQQKRNAKFVAKEGGVLYPRAGTLGGCTAHNAMITICPHNADWDAIARTFGDPSFSATNMRRYFERLERCNYAPKPSDAPGAPNPSRHGFHGWLPTNVADTWLAIKDGKLRRIVEAALDEAGAIKPNLYREAAKMILDSDRALWDPNDWRTVSAVPEGLMFLPMHVSHGARSGTREYVRAVAAACPDNLHVELDALATRVVFDGDRAIGVEYLKGARLYRAAASADSREDAGERRVVRARREVILAGGVFNSPQLLMLSGVGPKADLERLGIEVKVDRPGVGKNLQDRYEIGVVSEMRGDFSVLEGARIAVPDPANPDPALERWWSDRSGPYATNGVVSALIKKSQPSLALPDLFLFGLVGNFRGYYPGYSRDLTADKRHFTWGVLKAHTRNTAGEVRLRSKDPRDRPEIDFHYFDEGSPGGREDLEAVVEGVVTVRRVMKRLGAEVVREVSPGPAVETREQIASFVRDHAWGHHASCTNKMGPASDPMSVVDNRFKVHGTRGLRVVDASVFPRIPGFFIVASVYMIAEKATDDIVADADAAARGDAQNVRRPL